jgi:hypothetical protein
MLTVLLAFIAAGVGAAPSPQAPSKGSGGSGVPKSSGSSGGIGGLISDIGFGFVTSGNPVPNGPAPKGCSTFEILIGELSRFCEACYSSFRAYPTDETFVF